LLDLFTNRQERGNKQKKKQTPISLAFFFYKKEWGIRLVDLKALAFVLFFLIFFFMGLTSLKKNKGYKKRTLKPTTASPFVLLIFFFIKKKLENTKGEMPKITRVFTL